MFHSNIKMSDTSYVTCTHPDHDHVYCEIKVKWKYVMEATVMYYQDGSGHPGSEELTIEECEVVSYCDRHVRNEEDKVCPDWIDWEYVEEQIMKEVEDY